MEKPSDNLGKVVGGGSGGGIVRMVDANLNRIAEGLRTVEDVARFVLGREDLVGRIKVGRHEVTRIGQGLGMGQLGLMAARDTSGDVGVGVKTVQEGGRKGVGEMVIAGCKRAEEGLRVVEECAKVLGVYEAGRSAERIRYAMYEIEREIVLAIGTGRGAQWAVCVLISERLCKLAWLDVARLAIAGGAGCIQLREKELEGGELVLRGRKLVELARNMAGKNGKEVAVIVNDRVDVALACGADGVHLGQGDMSVFDVRKLAGERLMVGVSTHDMAEARRAVADGADYCGVGAMFATSTKVRGVSGMAFLKEFIETEGVGKSGAGGVPHLAIGGITLENCREIVKAGGRGVAVSSAVCRAEDPRGVVAKMVAAIEGV